MDISKKEGGIKYSHYYRKPQSKHKFLNFSKSGNEGIKKSKAQVSLEFMVIIGFVMLISLPLIFIFYTYSYETEFDLSQNQAYSIANKVVDQAEYVYYQGTPSKATLKTTMPKNIKSIEIQGKEITIKMEYKGKETDIVAISKVNLSGTLSPSPGIRYISIQATGVNVTISG